MKPTHSQSGEALLHAKQALRRRMRKLRASLGHAAIASASEMACTRAIDLIGQTQVSSVALYAERGPELATSSLAGALRSRGVTLVYPRVVPGQATLAFHRVTADMKLQPSNFGVPEPPPHAEQIPAGAVDLFLVPGLAFDREGRRLGWGKGYYDATLAQTNGLRVGFCFAQQVVPEVPTSEHDLRMDVMITELDCWYTGARDSLPVRSNP